MADVKLWNPEDKVVTQYLREMGLKAKEKDMLLTPEAMAADVVSIVDL
jgi:hypothetical protein